MANPEPLLPLKNFQEYFGRIKPSLAKELKSIFQRTSLEQQLTDEDYGVTGRVCRLIGPYALLAAACLPRLTTTSPLKV